MNILVEKNVLENNLIEYSASIDKKEVGYYLSGMIDETDFLKIVEGLNFR